MGLKPSRERGEVPWRGSVKDEEWEIGQLAGIESVRGGIGCDFQEALSW